MPQYPLLLMRSSCASQVALTANDPAEATAAAEVLAAFCEEYREGQQMLAATFAPPQALSTQHKRDIHIGCTSLRSKIRALDFQQRHHSACLQPIQQLGSKGVGCQTREGPAQGRQRRRLALSWRQR